MERDGYLKVEPYARKKLSSGSITSSQGSVSRQINKVKQTNTLPSQRNSPLGRAISEIDLSHLSEEERAKVLNVVQRDLKVRVVEKERLKRFRTSLLRRDREVAAKSQTLAQNTNCLLCGQKFVLLINPQMRCKNCGRQICKRCSEQVAEVNGPLCRLCLKETGYRAMRCNWFYDTVINRFREFGSTAVAKSIFGEKYQHIQNIAEDELSNIISMYGANEEGGEVIVNEQKVPSKSMDKAKDVQLEKLRNKLNSLMKNTLKEYQTIDGDRNLSEQQRYWQGGRISLEFRKAATKELRNFTQTFYITTERQRSMQGASSRNVTQYVMNTLQQEVSRIVGHPVKNIDDNISLASDDDLESVAYAEREGIEERLAEVLLEKVLDDRKNPSKTITKATPRNSVSQGRPTPQITVTEEDDQYDNNGRPDSPESPSRASTASPTEPTGESDQHPYLKSEKITVEEGTPTRLEMKVDFNEHCEFTWLREDKAGGKRPVKCDFHCEHVITGASDPDGRDYFVLSNSGQFSAEATQRLLKTNKQLKQQGANYGVVVQHQLIFWAAKLEDSGRYFAVARTPAGNGTFAVNEAEYVLTVEAAPKWPIHPIHSPDFVHPLTLVPPSNTSGKPCLELVCTVASNPAPRCLFYRNNTPIPVVIMPALTNEDDNVDISLSSFSQKFTVVSSPAREAKALMSVGYLRKLLLRIHNPMPEDVAMYTCRAWNMHGRVESRMHVTAADIQARSGTRINGTYPRTSLPDRLQQTHNGVLNSAREIEQTAQTHGDVLGEYERNSIRTPPSPGRSQILNHDEIADLHAQYARSNSKSSTLTHGSLSPTSKSSRPNLADLHTQYAKTNSKPPVSPIRSQSQSFSQQDRVNVISQDASRPYHQMNGSRRISITRATDPEASSPVTSSPSTKFHEPPSPTSSICSGSPNIPPNGSPFVRQSSRRSSGPRIVVDRRSQSRKRVSASRSSESNSRPM